MSDSGDRPKGSPPIEEADDTAAGYQALRRQSRYESPDSDITIRESGLPSGLEQDPDSTPTSPESPLPRRLPPPPRKRRPQQRGAYFGDDDSDAFPSPLPSSPLKTAPGAKFIPPNYQPAIGEQPISTQPMSSVSRADEPSLPPVQLRSATRKGDVRSPVLAPSPELTYPHAVTGQDGDLKPPRPTQPQDLSALSQSGMDQPKQPQRRSSLLIAVVVVFICCFVGTGSVALWLSAGDGGSTTDGVSDASPRVAVPHMPPPPSEPEPSNSPQGSVNGQSPQPMTPPSSLPQESPQATDPASRASALIQLGDQETQLITPVVDVSSRDDLERVINTPRSHYDNARRHYLEAARHDPSRVQCTLSHSATAAERLSQALLQSAAAPQILALDRARFPQELRDMAASYRSTAHRGFNRAVAATPVERECLVSAREGAQRTAPTTP